MKVVVAAVLCASVVFGQAGAKKKAAAPAGPAPAPVATLGVEGNPHVPTAAILSTAGIKVGDIATPESFEAARQKLADTGFFSHVAFEYRPAVGKTRGYDAKFIVTEVSPLYPIEFAGLPGTDIEAAAWLKSHDPLYSGVAPPTKPLVDRWAALLTEWSASRNGPKQIIGKIENGATPGEFVIQFRPNTPLPAVAKIAFTGNEAINEHELLKVMAPVAFGLPYNERNFRELLDAQLRPVYEAQGYLHVKFDDIRSEPAPLPTKGVIVHMRITEGPVYKLSAVKVWGVEQDDRAMLVRKSGLKTGVTANFDDVAAGATKIKEAMKRSGYYNVDVNVDRTVNDKERTVEVTYKVDLGTQFLFRNLTIEGLDLNGEAAVRKLWGEKPGDPFNPGYPDHFLSSVKDMGIFDYLGDMKSVAHFDEKAHAADVTLVFKAKPLTAKDLKR